MTCHVSVKCVGTCQILTCHPMSERILRCRPGGVLLPHRRPCCRLCFDARAAPLLSPLPTAHLLPHSQLSKGPCTLRACRGDGGMPAATAAVAAQSDPMLAATSGDYACVEGVCGWHMESLCING